MKTATNRSDYLMVYSRIMASGDIYFLLTNVAYKSAYKSLYLDVVVGRNVLRRMRLYLVH